VGLLFAHTLAFSALPREVNGQQLPSLADMLEKVMPAVVDIATEGKQAEVQASVDTAYHRLFGSGLPKRARGTGSGIITEDKNISY